jgi:single-strand DNA-binding protein
MSRGVNMVVLVCTVGKDPEVKYMPSGQAVVNLTAATNESWKDKQTGEKKERTEWHRLVFYARAAEIVGEYVRKGSQLFIKGKLRTRQYTKDGQDHYSTEVIVDDMQMLGGPKGQERPAAPERQPASEPAGGQDFQDDDIPF